MNSTAKELRFQTKKILETVSRGEEVIITFRGKACAKLVSIDEPTKKNSIADGLFGIWKDRKDIKDVSAYVRTLRVERF